MAVKEGEKAKPSDNIKYFLITLKIVALITMFSVGAYTNYKWKGRTTCVFWLMICQSLLMCVTLVFELVIQPIPLLFYLTVISVIL